MVDAIYKRSIKGDKSHFFGVSECCQVCVSPQLGIWMRAIGHCAKSNFRIRWFVEKKHPVVMEPSIVGRPGFSLSHGVVAHDRAGGQQTKQADLGEATEAKPVGRIQALEPPAGDLVAFMTFPGEGEPNIHIREKE